MNRRQTLLTLTVFGLAPSFALSQQSRKKWRIGFLNSGNQPVPDFRGAPFIGAFPSGLKELGYEIGKDLVIEWRGGEGNSERLARLARELVQLPVDIIVTAGTAATAAAQGATRTTPIVMAGTNDPVHSGFVQSLARPGGNITGLSLLADEISSKQTELLRECVPKLSRIGVLLSPANMDNSALISNIQSAVRRFNGVATPYVARNASDMERSISAMPKHRVEALVIGPDALFNQYIRDLVALTNHHALPSIFSNSAFAELGGFLSYGPSRFASYRRAAAYVDKIIRGAKPESLPIEQPTTFEFIVNAKTAKSLGLRIPQSILLRADRVIE